jgi:2-succinyl-6-hydroxy-2,4-cyclohexadiene-1-carboxylate synthase
MEILNNGITVNVICESDYVHEEKTPIIFLHGFTGSAEDWQFIFPKLNPRFFPIAIDLPGHGKTICPDNSNYFTTESYKDTVDIVLNHLNIKKAIFVGYSMGGRTALSFATANPEKIIALVLESTTAGIINEQEKKSRIKTDLEIADRIISDGMESFTEYCLNLVFFTSLKSLNDKDYFNLIEAKKRNSPEGLSNSLKGFSTGKMPSLWNKINILTIPTLLITGILDKKFVRINKEMNQQIKNSKLKVIENCGHNTHLENKEEFTILVNNFLNTLN